MDVLSSHLSVLRGQFSRMTDLCRGKNARYAMSDIVMTAFSVFFFQSILSVAPTSDE